MLDFDTIKFYKKEQMADFPQYLNNILTFKHQLYANNNL